MTGYAFGAGGFKLGERVEILTTGQRERAMLTNYAR